MQSFGYGLLKKGLLLLRLSTKKRCAEGFLIVKLAGSRLPLNPQPSTGLLLRNLNKATRMGIYIYVYIVNNRVSPM